MFTIENQSIRITVNTAGELTSLKNLTSGRECVMPGRFLRLILQDRDCLEFEAMPSGLPHIRLLSECSLEVAFDTAEGENGKSYDICSRAIIELEGRMIHWNLYLNNRTSETIVRESHCPVLAIHNPAPPMAYLNSQLVSTKIYDLPGELSRAFTGYIAVDHKYTSVVFLK